MEQLTTLPDSQLAEAPPRFLNGELSQLQFFRRVLEEARDSANPVLERVRFLALFGAHLDEFFMVRVANLKEQMAAETTGLTGDGLSPTEQLAMIRATALALMQEAQTCWRQELQPELHHVGIHIRPYADLTPMQKQAMRSYFETFVFPVLTPLAVDPGRPFPFISNLSLNLAIVTWNASGRERFARVKVPGTLPRLVPLLGARTKTGVSQSVTYVWLEEVIAAHLDLLFPNVHLLSYIPSSPGRVSRQKLAKTILRPVVIRSVLPSGLRYSTQRLIVIASPS